MEERREWFESWFDSPYYHILYDHRDFRESEQFILKLRDRLQLDDSDRVLDLGCGAGRHAAYLAGITGETIGVDISVNSIRSASERYRKPNLEFYMHDMRLPFRINYFDYIFNFFTTFGYFKRQSDNFRVLRSARKGLRKDGRLLIDFMNARKSVRDLVERETIRKQDIDFYIRREVLDGKILKHITFNADEKVFSFTESVQALQREDFHTLLEQTGFTIESEFGDYDLGDFEVNISPRYIVLAGTAS